MVSMPGVIVFVIMTASFVASLIAMFVHVTMVMTAIHVHLSIQYIEEAENKQAQACYCRLHPEGSIAGEEMIHPARSVKIQQNAPPHEQRQHFEIKEKILICIVVMRS
ncbi:MAG: hypothetical protein KDN22_19330 [Verrucomicrobiae bacterium]|nr:hypothetical protein [Verrucomicrobiae bacterium]